jgi:hypothetical protein
MPKHQCSDEGRSPDIFVDKLNGEPTHETSEISNLTNDLSLNGPGFSAFCFEEFIHVKRYIFTFRKMFIKMQKKVICQHGLPTFHCY